MLISNNPFYKNEGADINTLHLTILKELPTNENLNKVKAYDYSPDKFIVDGQEVFVFIPGKYHLTKLGNAFFEKKLKTPTTTRNWKTVLKLLELAK